jgi:Tol biopolymer transport system component
LIGKTIGHYDVTAEIGRGGMGEVYRARDTKLGRDVAIKTLPPEFARDSERLARFDREAKLLASLNHPDIAAIYGLEESGGMPFLVLELVEGETLAERLTRGAIPVEEAVKLALQIVEALEAAHEKGVIHRDLKTANIKITPEGKVKVLDFGLAKAFAEDQPTVNLSNSPTLSVAGTTPGIILGTAAYMSPEQAKGRKVDKRTDIWAFGCVLYEMLTGRPAWAGETVTDIIASAIARDPDWSLLPANIHPRLGELLRRCLEKDPKKRWHDAGDVHVELENILGDPTGMRVRSTAAIPPQSKLRRVLPWAMAAFAVAAIAAFAAWTLKPAPSPEPRIVTRFDYELPAGRAFRNTGRPIVALSPDGRQFVYNTGVGLYLRSMDALEARLITGTAEALNNPFFAPDGQWVGYFFQDQLKKIATSGGAPVILCKAAFPFGANWEPDGTILFGQPDGIWRVSANGGTPELIVRTKAGEQADGPSLLPGGKWILFSLSRGAQVNRWDTAEIVAQSVATGERKVLWRGGSDARYVPTGHLVYAFGNVLFAVPFDPDRLEVTGGPTPVIEDIQRATVPNTNTAAANYGVSGGGTLIYVRNFLSSSTKGVPAFVDRSGGIERLKLPPNEYRSPRLSPDGRQIAVEIVGADQRSAVWVYDLSGGTQIRRLTQEGNNILPIWTPDSRRITFASDRDGSWGIYWQPADGSGMAERLTTAEKGAQQVPDSWSPDGRVLAFVNQGVAGNTNTNALWTLSLERRASELFYDVPNEAQASMAFSPDGKWVAYASREQAGGELGIFVERFPRVPGVRYQITATNESHPLWSRDGKELFYRVSTNAGRAAAISRVEVRTEGAFTFTNEQTLPFQGFLTFLGYSNYDISPDGRRFLVLVRADQTNAAQPARPQIHIVENWFEELKRAR